MLNVDEIDKTILDLETRHDTSFATCEKLAWLYIVKDHVTLPQTHRNAPQGIGSEFLEVISGKDEEALFGVLNEHIEAVKILHPKEYAALIQKIKDL